MAAGPEAAQKTSPNELAMEKASAAGRSARVKEKLVDIGKEFSDVTETCRRLQAEVDLAKVLIGNLCADLTKEGPDRIDLELRDELISTLQAVIGTREEPVKGSCASARAVSAGGLVTTVGHLEGVHR